MDFKFKRENITKLNPNTAIVAASFCPSPNEPNNKGCAHSFCLRVLLGIGLKLITALKLKILIGKEKDK